jgi:hypothetical protein
MVNEGKGLENLGVRAHARALSLLVADRINTKSPLEG